MLKSNLTDKFYQVSKARIVTIKKAALAPVLRANPVEEHQVLRSDWMSPLEILYEGTLAEIKKKGFYLIYFCAPLKETPRESFPEKSSQEHVMEALRAASEIMGAKWQEKDVSIWIPHLHVLPIFNELSFPQARRAAIEFNRRLLQDTKFFDALVVYGNRISEGMRSEIETARTSRLTIMSYDDFRKNAKRLPSIERALDYFGNLASLFDSNKHTFFIP